jgi:hypothetical protein
VLAATLLALSITTVAHAQGTMDFSGAQTLTGTFKRVFAQVSASHWRGSPLPYYKWHSQPFKGEWACTTHGLHQTRLYRERRDELWANGSISSELAENRGCPLDVMGTKWPQTPGCFQQSEDGRLFNQTLKDYRTEVDRQRITMAESS